MIKPKPDPEPNKVFVVVATGPGLPTRELAWYLDKGNAEHHAKEAQRIAKSYELKNSALFDKLHRIIKKLQYGAQQGHINKDIDPIAIAKKSVEFPPYENPFDPGHTDGAPLPSYSVTKQEAKKDAKR